MITPSFNLTATERVLPRLALDWTTGSAQSGVDVARAGVATFVGSNGLIQSTSSDTQRIDYSTGVAGLLVEESRTNLALASGDLSNATYWVLSQTGTGVTPITTASAGIAPDGTISATRIVFDKGAGTTSSDFSFVAQTFTVLSNPHTLTNSFYIKSYNGADQKLRLRMSGGSSKSITATNVWQRVDLTETRASTVNSFQFGLRGDWTETAQTADVLVWGGQSEIGAFPTSYIPTEATEATAVTRNADVATVTGTNFSDWYNIDQGTIVCEFQANADPSINAFNILAVGDGTSNNRQQHYASSLSPFLLYRTAKAGVANNIAFTGYSATTNPLRTAYSYSDDRLASALNGGSVSTITQDPPDSVDRMYVGGAFAGQVGGAFTMRKILYYPQQLTDAELQAFSKQG